MTIEIFQHVFSDLRVIFTKYSNLSDPRKQVTIHVFYNLNKNRSIERLALPTLRCLHTTPQPNIARRYRRKKSYPTKHDTPMAAARFHLHLCPRLLRAFASSTSRPLVATHARNLPLRRSRLAAPLAARTRRGPGSSMAAAPPAEDEDFATG
jgi:hypothetical protein